MNGGGPDIESPPILAEMAVPKADTLYCFTATIDAEDLMDPSARSDFHWQTIKCRILVFSVPVLACPVRVPGAPLRDLTVVCRREDVQEDIAEVEGDDAGRPPPCRLSEVRARLTALRLSLSRLRLVTDAEYSACLEYTMTARLGPLWNPVAERLLQGKDFLADGKLKDAVRLQVNVRGEAGVAWLGVSCSRMRIVVLDCARDLHVSAPALERFQGDPLGTVPSACIGKPWVHVLPSLKRALVMDISKTVPYDCPFRRYKDIRRHWKNMYGYRLREEAGDMLYASVYFEVMGKPLCYPFPCLTPQPPTVLRSLDPQAVATAFLGDVSTRMATVCGVPSPVTLDGLMRPVAALQTAAGPGHEHEDGDGGRPPNLRPLGENTPSPPREPSDDGQLTCPVSLATQRDGTRPSVEWSFLKRAPTGVENKENVPPEDRAEPRTPQRPVFRSRPRSRNPAREPPKVWFRPSCSSSPQSTAASAMPRSSSSSAVEYAKSPAHSCSGDAGPRSVVATPTPAPHVPTFRIPAHKPIFLARPKPAAKAPTKPGGKAGRAAPGGSGGPQQPGAGVFPTTTSASGAGAGLGPRAAGAKARASGAPPAPAPSRKRPSSEAVPVPDLSSAEACRRASIPLLRAWLRDKGVASRAKDKKADLVARAVAKLAELGH